MISSTIVGSSQQKLRLFMRRHEMLLGGESVLIAVSGGVDSMALLDLVSRFASVMKLQIGVAHFDHELRGEISHEDANFVSEQARIRGLKPYVGRADVKKLAADRRLSLEEAARKARYYFLERIAKRHGYSVVMTGHNADDNAETLLLNLMRGSGVTGLAGIPPVRPFGKGMVLARPLLWATRAEIEEYAGAVGIEWREDETNASSRFTRNRVRHELIPVLKEYNPAIVATLNSTAEIMRGVEQFLGHSVRAAIKRVVIARTPESIDLNIQQLKHYLPAIQTELVQRIVSKNFDTSPIPYSAVERTLSLLWKETGSRAELVGGISVVRDRDTLSVRRDPPPFTPVEKVFEPGAVVDAGKVRLITRRLTNEGIQFSNKRHIEYLDADKLSNQLTIRSWREGDRFHPLGMEGEKKLSDFLIDAKVPLDKKRDVLVLADGDAIVWVCGMRIDERFKIGPQTTNVLRLELQGSGGRSGDESRRDDSRRDEPRKEDSRRSDSRREHARRDDARKAGEKEQRKEPSGEPRRQEPRKGNEPREKSERPRESRADAPKDRNTQPRAAAAGEPPAVVGAREGGGASAGESRPVPRNEQRRNDTRDARESQRQAKRPQSEERRGERGAVSAEPRRPQEPRVASERQEPPRSELSRNEPQRNEPSRNEPLRREPPQNKPSRNRPSRKAPVQKQPLSDVSAAPTVEQHRENPVEESAGGSPRSALSPAVEPQPIRNAPREPKPVATPVKADAGASRKSGGRGTRPGRVKASVSKPSDEPETSGAPDA